MLSQIFPVTLVFLERALYSPSRFSKLLQPEGLAGEATASLKLLTGVDEIVGDATGGVLLEGCD